MSAVPVAIKTEEVILEHAEYKLVALHRRRSCRGADGLIGHGSTGSLGRTFGQLLRLRDGLLVGKGCGEKGNWIE